MENTGYVFLAGMFLGTFMDRITLLLLVAGHCYIFDSKIYNNMSLKELYNKLCHHIKEKPKNF